MPPVGTDPAVYYTVTQYITDHHTIEMPQLPSVPLEKGLDGAWVSKYPIGQSLVEIPFYAAASALSARLPDRAYVEVHTYFLTSLCVPLAAACCLMFLYLICLELGATTAVSTFVMATAGFASLLFPQSRHAFSEPLQAACLTGAFLHSLRAACAARAVNSFAAGTFIAVAALAKTVNFAFAPIFAIFIAAQLVRNHKAQAGAAAAHAAAFALPISLAVAITLTYNHIRYGDMMNFGYGAGRDALFAFSVPALSGLYGLMLSPGKSIFLYTPALIAALAACRSFARRHAPAAWLAAACVAAQIAIYCKWWAWHGDWTWGPRFFTPVIAIALIPLCTAFGQFREARFSRKLSLAAIIIASLAVQIPGVAVNPNEYIGYTTHNIPSQPFYMPGRIDMRDDLLLAHFIPEFSPVAGHLWIMRQMVTRTEAPYPWRTLVPAGTPPHKSILIPDFWWARHKALFPDSLPVIRGEALLMLAAGLAALAGFTIRLRGSQIKQLARQRFSIRIE